MEEGCAYGAVCSQSRKSGWEQGVPSAPGAVWLSNHPGLVQHQAALCLLGAFAKAEEQDGQRPTWVSRRRAGGGWGCAVVKPVRQREAFLPLRASLRCAEILHSSQNQTMFPLWRWPVSRLLPRGGF